MITQEQAHRIRAALETELHCEPGSMVSVQMDTGPYIQGTVVRLVIISNDGGETVQPMALRIHDGRKQRVIPWGRIVTINDAIDPRWNTVGDRECMGWIRDAICAKTGELTYGKPIIKTRAGWVLKGQENPS